MPKKVMKEIQRICRNFLWSWSDAESKKASVAWESMCLPKNCGGLNLKDLTVWNKSAVIKHCWALAMKQDRLWIKWIHVYYVKNKDFWSMDIPEGLTWSLRKVWASREILTDVGGPDQFVHVGKSSIHKMYKHLRQQGSSVIWKRIICNSKASPKATFVAWLALQNRLATKDRLVKWNLQIEKCCYSKAVWNGVLARIGEAYSGSNWQDVCHWAAKKSRSKRSRAKVCSCAFTETVYAIWLQRNAKIFRNTLDQSEVVISRMLFHIACRSDDRMKVFIQ
ncbi:uncharacterized protein [Spinacia oleracea]|uniref:Reverse transcriptase zinc-binding domain-containing protein n=1 Tax=Spinacia oleracea TaxID=3562 RepID=A0ABM3R3H8_SPIOL|nr:uncharacterized protein LOC110793502 [Spinacia oleracea]